VKPWKSPLLLTFVVSIVLLLAVGGWLLSDPGTSRADALKTGGLAGGAVVALYALWLNDRRRRVEEGRHEVERQRHELEKLRTEHDRSRISDERFAKSVELLGNDADQVRVGAMHALAALARNREEYTQTVLDVLCSYLRRPFEHPRHHDVNTDGGRDPHPGDGKDPAAERELQVRLTAQRLIRNLLPAAGDAESISYDLDLTGASLEYFDLSERKIGQLVMRYVNLRSSNSFWGCRFTGPVWFTEASTGRGRLSGRFHCHGATFHDRAWFSGTKFGDLADFSRTIFAGQTAFKNAVFSGDALFKDASFTYSLDLRYTRFQGQYTNLNLAEIPSALDLYNTMVDPAREVRLPQSWSQEPLSDGLARVVSGKSG
jgi:hypothetical protein